MDVVYLPFPGSKFFAAAASPLLYEVLFMAANMVTIFSPFFILTFNSSSSLPSHPSPLLPPLLSPLTPLLFSLLFLPLYLFSISPPRQRVPILGLIQYMLSGYKITGDATMAQESQGELFNKEANVCTKEE